MLKSNGVKHTQNSVYNNVWNVIVQSLDSTTCMCEMCINYQLYEGSAVTGYQVGWNHSESGETDGETEGHYLSTED